MKGCSPQGVKSDERVLAGFWQLPRSEQLELAPIAACRCTEGEAAAMSLGMQELPKC